MHISHRRRQVLVTRVFISMLALALGAGGYAAEPYYPDRHHWERIDPAETGFDPERLAAAVAWARGQAVTEPADLRQVIHDSFATREPDFRILGPTRPRAGDSGLVIRRGRIAAEWGDLTRADMTFSAVKSYLATVAGLAFRDGLIANPDDRVGAYCNGGRFRGEYNAAITWHHLLNQTSDWSGALWEIHDWADRPEGDDPAAWSDRPLHPPGTRFKYNDVRVNLLALCLLEVFREPLPVVLRREVMDPIGASNTWRWHGYRNSWIELDGLRMQSVSGGGHFGGGMFINTYDHARFGLLMLRRGAWRGRQLIPEGWIERMRQSTPVRPDYGYLWWLNTDRERIPEAPETAYWAAGFGGNYIYIDETHDLVILLRWIPSLEGVVKRVLGALNDP